MHILQKQLLQLSYSHNLGGLTLSQIGDLVGGNQHRQTIKYHLEQLEKDGYITWDRENNLITRITNGNVVDRNFFAIPILGAADCGPATMYADENIEGYLKISNKLLNPKRSLYALRAVGSSMDKAQVNTKTIDDGDYVIVDSELRNPMTGEYVVSVIDGVCNVKKYFEDRVNNQVVLMSESTKNFPPIFVHPEDKDYLVTGKVVEVIKTPKFNERPATAN